MKLMNEVILETSWEHHTAVSPLRTIWGHQMFNGHNLNTVVKVYTVFFVYLAVDYSQQPYSLKSDVSVIENHPVRRINANPTSTRSKIGL